MTRKQQRALQRYVNKIAPLLALTDWELEVLDEPPTIGNSVAQVSCPFGRRYAALRFNPSITEDDVPVRFIAETVIHELLHAQRAQSKHTLWQTSHQMKKPARETHFDAYNAAQEYEVDSLSISLAKVFPEFSW